jgi:transposase-like protein
VWAVTSIEPGPGTREQANGVRSRGEGFGQFRHRVSTGTLDKREQVVRKLTEADRLLAEGKDVAEVCRVLQVTEPTYYRWRNQFGGLKADDAKKLKELERENTVLKRLLAEAELLPPLTRITCPAT